MTLTYPIPRLSLLVVYCNIYFSLSSRLSLCTRQTTPNSNRPNTSNSSSSDEPACLGSLKSPAISPSQVPARRSQSQRLGCGIDGLPLSEADMQGDPDRRYILDIASIVVLVYVLLPQNNSVLVNLRASLTLWSM